MAKRYEVPGSEAIYPAWSGNSIQLYNDGCADKDGNGALADMLKAIQEARHFVFICDWSFHPVFRIQPNGAPIGEILATRAVESKDLLIAIHTWNHTWKASTDVQNDNADALLLHFLERAIRERNETVSKSGGSLLAPPGAPRWKPSNLLCRISSRTRVGYSHHQKFVALDTAGPDGRRMVTVFFGGLDLTQGRFDWGAHLNHRQNPELAWMIDAVWENGRFYDEWYSCEFTQFAVNPARYDLPRQTWHDIHAKLTGPVAWDFVREFVARWTPEPQIGANDSTVWTPLNAGSLFLKRPVIELFDRLLNRKLVVQQDEKAAYAKGRFRGQLVHSIRAEHWTAPDIGGERLQGESLTEKFPWVKGFRFLRDRKWEASIQEAYRNLIDGAERFIYIENQYFIGSGKHWTPEKQDTVTNDIPERLVRRILERWKDDFHIYIVLPLFPEGNPADGTIAAVRYNQWCTIDYMIRKLYHSGLGDQWRRFLSFYFLGQWEGEKKAEPHGGGKRAERVRNANRYMIYTHAKAMICDDTAMVLGSCNLNERGLAGDRDTEICVSFWPDREGDRECRNTIQGLRRKLWTEHLGLGVHPSDLGQGWWEAPERQACVQQVLLRARRNYINFRLNTNRESSGHLCAWPLVYDPDLNETVLLGVPDGLGYRPARNPRDYEHELIADHEDVEALRAAASTPGKVRELLKEVRKSQWAVRYGKNGYFYLTE